MINIDLFFLQFEVPVTGLAYSCLFIYFKTADGNISKLMLDSAAVSSLYWI